MQDVEKHKACRCARRLQILRAGLARVRVRQHRALSCGRAASVKSSTLGLRHKSSRQPSRTRWPVQIQEEPSFGSMEGRRSIRAASLLLTSAQLAKCQAMFFFAYLLGSVVAIDSTSANSSPAIGGSAPTTTNAASTMGGMNACVVAVFPVKTPDPNPAYPQNTCRREQQWAGHKYYCAVHAPFYSRGLVPPSRIPSRRKWQCPARSRRACARGREVRRQTEPQ